MDLDYVKVTNVNSEVISDIYDILKVSGEYMFERFHLNHWIPAYSKTKIQKDISNKDVFLVFDGNEAVNTFQLDFLDSNFAELQKFATYPSFQGKGIGSQVLNYIEQYCIEKGISKIRLSVYENSRKAVAFYEKNNFYPVGERKTRNFIVVIMEKKLID